ARRVVHPVRRVPQLGSWHHSLPIKPVLRGPTSDLEQVVTQDDLSAKARLCGFNPDAFSDLPIVGLARGERARGSGPPAACARRPTLVHEVVVRSSHAPDAGVGSMDTVRTGFCAGAGTGRRGRCGTAAHHPHKRAQPPDTEPTPASGA